MKGENPRLKLDQTVIPSMKILREDTNYSMRILAAMALFELRDERGLYAIREAARFDGHQTVRHICSSMIKQAK